MSDTPYRLLLISDRYLPEVGGTITWFDNVYRRHPANTIWVATQAYGDTEKFDREYQPISVSRAKLQRYRFLKPESLLLFIRLFRMCLSIRLRHKIDVVHVGKVFPEGYVARIMRKLTGTPYVVYAHGEDVTIYANDPAYRSRLPTIYNAAAAVIANSDFTRNELIKVGVHPELIVKISPGVDPSVFAPAKADQQLISDYDLDGKFVLLSVGRLTKRKGHDYVLQALPAVLERFPNVVYVIVSTGAEEENLKRMAAKLGVEESVRFVGEVSYQQLPRFFNTSDLFVLANRSLPTGDVEGFGIVFVEAGACEIPVIAGDSGGTADPVRHGVNGLRIDASDPANIENAILTLVDNPHKRMQMGREGRRIVEQEYSWERVFERTTKLTNQVLDGTFQIEACKSSIQVKE